MQYITGIHALNLNCSLETTGDWHQSALAWKNIDIRRTEDSVYGDWGLEFGKMIPEHGGVFVVANHIRACLDLLAVGNFALAQGMREDFICNETYTPLVFEKAMLLTGCCHWADIDAFLGREYKLEWLAYKEVVGLG